MELNVYKPLLISALLHSIRLLADGARARVCVWGGRGEGAAAAGFLLRMRRCVPWLCTTTRASLNACDALSGRNGEARPA